MLVVLEELVYDFEEVSSLLESGEVNEFTVQLQRNIEESLAELIEVIKREIEERESNGGGGGGGGGGGDNPLLPPSAELKMIRIMQAQVNHLTRRFDSGREDVDLTPAQEQAVEHISERQSRVGEFTRRLHERLNGED